MDQWNQPKWVFKKQADNGISLFFAKWFLIIFLLYLVSSNVSVRTGTDIGFITFVDGDAKNDENFASPMQHNTHTWPKKLSEQWPLLILFTLILCHIFKIQILEKNYLSLDFPTIISFPFHFIFICLFLFTNIQNRIEITSSLTKVFN